MEKVLELLNRMQAEEFRRAARCGGVMSTKKFDPYNFRIEELFEAKERRRKELARLPFEKKIEIVERLQTVVREIQKQQSKDEAKREKTT
jgi:hypothetical protein